MRQPEDKRGFSLLELLVVVVIIAILAGISLPRASRGARDTRDSSLSSNLLVLRRAINLYALEHEGMFPAANRIEEVLTLYSDASGTTSRVKTSQHTCGPYLGAIPPLPVGVHRGKTLISTADGVDIGWIYDPSLGTIKPNTNDVERDNAGRPYNNY